MPECEECVRLRELYWRAINECVRLSERIPASPGGTMRDSLYAEYVQAERDRITGREKLLAHQEECHDPWTRGGKVLENAARIPNL